MLYSNICLVVRGRPLLPSGRFRVDLPLNAIVISSRESSSGGGIIAGAGALVALTLV